MEHFRNHLYGRDFEIRTDHRALLSALKTNRGNKTEYSRLVKWMDRLLPFNFNIEHIPGKSLGWAAYSSRHPFGEAKQASEYDEKYVIATIARTRKLLGFESSSSKNAAQTSQKNNHMTDRKSIPNEHKQNAFHSAQQPELKDKLNSLAYLDRLEEEVIPKYVYEMLSSLNLLSRGNPRQPTDQMPQPPLNQAGERGRQTDPDVEATERITWRQVVNEIRNNQEPNPKIHMATNTESEKLLPTILDRGVIAAITGDDKELRRVRKVVMKKKQEDEEKIDNKWKRYLRELNVQDGNLFKGHQLVILAQIRNAIIHT